MADSMTVAERLGCMAEHEQWCYAQAGRLVECGLVEEAKAYQAAGEAEGVAITVLWNQQFGEYVPIVPMEIVE